MSDPLQHHTTYSYDGSRQPRPVGGNVTTFVYDPDAAGDPLARPAAWVYTYEGASPCPAGDATGTTTYSYEPSSGLALPNDEPEPPAPDIVIDPEG